METAIGFIKIIFDILHVSIGVVFRVCSRNEEMKVFGKFN